MMNDKLRVAFAVNRFAPSTGGVETHIDRLSRELVAAGHSVTVLTHDHCDDEPAHEMFDGIEIHRFPLVTKSKHFAVSTALGGHLARAGRSTNPRYDLVHAHSYHHTPAVLTATVWRGPFIYTPHFHGSSDSRLRNLIQLPYRAVGGRVIDRADRVICVSGAESEHVVRTFPNAFGKTDVISNGVDVDRLRSAPLSKEVDGRRILLAAGQLDHHEQVDRLVSAMPYLKDDYVLKVTGNGPAREHLGQMVKDLELETDVHLLGRVPDDTLASLFRTASCLVSMSTHESHGIMLLEALAASTRVLASAIPAHVDVGRQTGGSVALTPVDVHPRRLATAVRDACAETRPDVFIPSWSEVALQTSMLYDRVLQRRSTPAATEMRRRSPRSFLRA